jgi:hypothetical protein
LSKGGQRPGKEPSRSKEQPGLAAKTDYVEDRGKGQKPWKELYLFKVNENLKGNTGS